MNQVSEVKYRHGQINVHMLWKGTSPVVKMQVLVYVLL